MLGAQRRGRAGDRHGVRHLAGARSGAGHRRLRSDRRRWHPHLRRSPGGHRLVLGGKRRRSGGAAVQRRSLLRAEQGLARPLRPVAGAGSRPHQRRRGSRRRALRLCAKERPDGLVLGRQRLRDAGRRNQQRAQHARAGGGPGQGRGRDRRRALVRLRAPPGRHGVVLGSQRQRTARATARPPTPTARWRRSGSPMPCSWAAGSGTPAFSTRRARSRAGATTATGSWATGRPPARSRRWRWSA